MFQEIKESRYKVLQGTLILWVKKIILLSGSGYELLAGRSSRLLRRTELRKEYLDMVVVKSRFKDCVFYIFKLVISVWHTSGLVEWKLKLRKMLNAL